MPLRVISRIKKSIPFAKSLKSSDLLDFDPVFYRFHYSDLHGLNSDEDLRRHYVLHGREEGRWKSRAEARNDFVSRFGALPDDFQAHVYKELHEDLAKAFDHEWQFEFHYLEHGRKEGRRYKREGNPAGDAETSWITLFRLGDFVACAQNWLTEVPRTQQEGIALFLEAGIERLAPINLDFVFDPEFYRSAYGFERNKRDVELYRHWLEIGMPNGLSPNEEKSLQDLLPSRRYPEAFDWRRYKSTLPTRASEGLRHRIDVLRHLFQTGFEKGLTNQINGDSSDELFAAIGDYHLIRGRHRLAIAAYNRALALNPLRPGILHLRGDAYAAIGEAAAAQSDFAAALALPNASIWSALHAARMAAANGLFEKAFEILASARRKWEKSADFRSTVDHLIERYFAARSQSAMVLYSGGSRTTADDYMLKTLAEIRSLIGKLTTLPPEMGPTADGHVTILANQDLTQCKHYRVEQKQRQFRRAGLDAEVFDQHDLTSFTRSLIGARAAIFYRVPAFPGILKAILTAKALGVPTYYEIDDLIFDAASYPDIFESYEGQISKSEYNGLYYGVPLFRYAMGLCDYGIASTTPLASHIELIVEKRECFVLRNGLDERNETAIEMGRVSRPQRDVVTIFYGSGTKAHNSDFNTLAGPALLFVLERYDYVRLVVVGHLQLRPEFDQFSSRVTRLGMIADLDQYWSLLGASDISLAVLSPGQMASCKSEIKWLEAAILQVPSIVSATATYLEVLQDGVDALIVDDNSLAWRKALTILIEDGELRRSIGAAARRKALQNYSLDAAAALLRVKLGSPIAVADADQNRCRKIKVLTCNVFFPPQTYGGATRVVKDNVDYIVDECSDIELSAFAVDEGVRPAGTFRLDQYRGIPVFRISTPLEPHMEWRPFNVEHVPIFEQILDRIRPDIIHFHCIQRLTASIVEVALKRRIPYLITVHDGWWISDHQFFVDRDDILRMPSSDLFEAAPPSGISLSESIARRQRLGSLLEAAEHVISVSESFADIYRKVGYRHVSAIPNGLSEIKATPKQRGLDGRLSLGHIGGRSAHKGAMLIEAVLRMNHFDHLKLTMIDFSMQPGARSERIWGNTPVALCGAYAQDQVGDLYASLDVLLAPSIWPESFGLVAREAQSQGLWVVTSNRGAMGEGIIPGENGFIIDVSDACDLTDLLRKLDADVVRYQAPPKVASSMRTAADQGAELAELYRKMGPAVRDTKSQRQE
ncbi:glycosyl transferase group 1 [Methylocella silvestris BL2]|uniref:Glycosyl transferase group 1 n=1 Tax=Methylocella silvestris (strain DSM 15510 / CIP 108128 / LMG 27833 / NCIMB 13906 / BL2) TaxID=395965 RepID=B8ERV9_METSB|nr:glycosyltransferase [Methylocella silvestris]ACK51657.1 glycosyl transferase group 1 [Methylocella silvestris BL2]